MELWTLWNTRYLILFHSVLFCFRRATFHRMKTAHFCAHLLVICEFCSASRVQGWKCVVQEGSYTPFNYCKPHRCERLERLKDRSALFPCFSFMQKYLWHHHNWIVKLCFNYSMWIINPHSLPTYTISTSNWTFLKSNGTLFESNKTLFTLIWTPFTFWNQSGRFEKSKRASYAALRTLQKFSTEIWYNFPWDFLDQCCNIYIL